MTPLHPVAYITEVLSGLPSDWTQAEAHHLQALQDASDELDALMAHVLEESTALQLRAELGSHEPHKLAALQESVEAMEQAYAHLHAYQAGGVVGETNAGRQGRGVHGDAETSLQAPVEKYLRSIWSHLSSAGVLPAAARIPPLEVLPGEGAVKGAFMYTQNFSKIVVPQAAARDLVDTKGKDHEYAEQALVHELAHSMQKKSLDRREAEGGAVAWSNYARWKAGFGPINNPLEAVNEPTSVGVNFFEDAQWVIKNKGKQWILHGQFRDDSPELGGGHYVPK